MTGHVDDTTARGVFLARRQPDRYAQTRVLIAERSRLYAEALMFALDANLEFEAVGYALDGWEALELTAELQPDVLLVGPELGGLDQLTLTRVTHFFWPRLRLILLGNAGPREINEAYALGAAEYLTPDRSAEELLTAIGAACFRQRRQERGQTVALDSLLSTLPKAGEIGRAHV